MGKYYRWEKNTLILQIRVQPRAKKDEVVEGGGSALKIKIKAPPVDGKANNYLVRFLAEQFDVPLNHIELVKGTQNRNKVVKIDSPKKLIAEIKAYTRK